MSVFLLYVCSVYDDITKHTCKKHSEFMGDELFHGNDRSYDAI